MKRSVILKESQLKEMIKESIKGLLNEDAWDVPYEIDDVIKKAYALRHQIHKMYDYCEYGQEYDKDDSQIEHPKKGLSNPSGNFSGADSKIERLLYDAYYSVDRLIKDLKQARNEFVAEMEEEDKRFEQEYEEWAAEQDKLNKNGEV